MPPLAVRSLNPSGKSPVDDGTQVFIIRFRPVELISDKACTERRVVPLTEVTDAIGIRRTTLSKIASEPG